MESLVENDLLVGTLVHVDNVSLSPVGTIGVCTVFSETAC
jgi:hypothetical protein